MKKTFTQLKPFAAALLAVSFLALWAATMMMHYRLAQAEPYIDEGDMAMNARIIHRGGLMYQDVFNEKGPGLYWLVAGLFHLFGDRLVLLRYASAGSATLTLLLLFAFGFRWQKPVLGLLAAGFYAVTHIFFLGFIYQAEAPMTPLFLMAFYLLTDRRDEPPSAGSVFFAGLALFGATTIKQTAWLVVLAAMMYLLVEGWRTWHTRQRKVIGQLLAFAGGLVLPWLVLLVSAQDYFVVFLRGYLFPLLEYNIDFYPFWPNRSQFLFQLPVWWMVFVSFLTLSMTKLTRGDKWLFGLMLTAVLVTMFPALFPYHFPPLLTLGSLGLALSLLHLHPSFSFMRWFSLGGLLLTLTIAVSSAPANDIKDQLFSPPRPVDAAIVREITTRTDANEPILVLPFNSLYYYWADRAHPGRHGFFLPWVIPTHVLPEVIEEFDNNPPSLVLYVYFDKCTTNGARPKDYLAPLLERLLAGYRIREIYPNNVIMLVPHDPSKEYPAAERCLLEKLLYTDLDCRIGEPPIMKWSHQCGL